MVKTTLDKVKENYPSIYNEVSNHIGDESSDVLSSSRFVTMDGEYIYSTYASLQHFSDAYVREANAINDASKHLKDGIAVLSNYATIEDITDDILKGENVLEKGSKSSSKPRSNINNTITLAEAVNELRGSLVNVGSILKRIKKAYPQFENISKDDIRPILQEKGSDIRGSRPITVLPKDAFEGTSILVDSSTVLSILDSNILNESHVKDSEEHTQFLRDTINELIGKVIKLDRHKGIFINIAKKASKTVTSGSVPMSGATAYVHELSHEITLDALDDPSNYVLRVMLQRLMNTVAKQFTPEERETYSHVFNNSNISKTSKVNEISVKSTSTTNMGLAEFVAFTKSEPNFRKLLDKYNGTKTTKIIGESWLETIGNIFSKLLQFYNTKFKDHNSSSALVQADRLITSLAMINSKHENVILEKLNNASEVIDSKYQHYLNNTALFLKPLLRRNYVEAFHNMTPSFLKPVSRILKYSLLTTANVIEAKVSAVNVYNAQVESIKNEIKSLKKEGKDTTDLEEELNSIKPKSIFDVVDYVYKDYHLAVGKLLLKMNQDEHSILSALGTEVSGETNITKVYHRLLDKSNHMVNQLKEFTTEVISKSIEDQFHPDTKLNEVTKKAVTEAMLNTSMSDLIDKYSLKGMSKLLTDSTYVDAEISNVISKLPKKYKIVLNNQSKNLATFMVHNQFIKNLLGVHNPNQVISYAGIPITDELVDTITHLSRLYAIKYSDSKAKKVSSKLIETELANRKDSNENGILFTLAHHQRNKEDYLRDILKGDKNLVVDGYTKDTFNPNNSVVLATLDEEPALIAQGYTRKGFPYHTGKETIYLYHSNVKSITPYQKMIFSLTTLNDSHSDYKEGFNISDDTRNIIRKDLAISNLSSNARAVMRSKVYSKLKVKGFKYLLDNESKKELLEMDNDFTVGLAKGSK